MVAVVGSFAAVEYVGPRLAAAVGLGLELGLGLGLGLVHDAVQVVDCWLLSLLSAQSSKPLLYQDNHQT